jgi:ABC-2 type transport system ATP-binding protein
MIEIARLLKIYGEQKAVNEISFNVNKGEIVGFLGPNGAGKSTTMKMLTGYLQPDGGTASVCGINVASRPLESKKKIGYLPESNALYYDMYVKEYLAFVAGIYKVPNAKLAINNVIEKVGLTPEYKKQIGQLSKGYKQRVGLAAALIHNPEVLILDEPTSGLDPNQIVEIREVIKQLGKDKTVLFSTHIMQEVEALCDRVVIINKGNIVADDRLANLNKKQSAGSVRVSFKEVLEAAWLQRLPAASTVSKIDSYNWEIESAQPELLRKQLLQLAIDENLNIISLQDSGGKLEEIFRALTTNAPAN